MHYHEKPGTPGEIRDVLEHYGVKGMRWGVRKQEDTAPRDAAKKDGPIRRDATGKVIPPPPAPPLSEKRQKRVDKFMKRADLMETRISEIKVANEALKGTRNPIKLYDRHINNQTMKQLQRTQKHAERDAEAVKKGKLTRKQKQVIAGAVGVTALVGLAYVMQGQQSGALNSWKLQGLAKLQGNKVPFKVNKELTGKKSAEELLHQIAKPVNPGYSKAGGKMNCRRSTYAYELRRRGFDVHATTSSVGWGQSESGVINALTTEGKDFFDATSMSTSVIKTGGSNVAPGDKRIAPGAKILLDGLKAKPGKSLLEGGTASVSSSKRVLEELAKQPNGARGEVMFKFPGQFGHSMAYEIVDGVPHIFDSQKGTLYNASKAVESKWDGFDAAEIRRLDNVDLDLNFLTRWADNN